MMHIVVEQFGQNDNGVVRLSACLVKEKFLDGNGYAW